MLRKQRGLHILIVSGLLASGCGDDGSSQDEAGTASGTATESGTEAEAGTEVGSTEAGSTDAETTNATTDATTDAETTDAETTDPTTDAETTDPTTDATTDATTETTGSGACAGFETADECTMAGCQVVNGSKLKENGPDSPCLEPSEFLGCIEPAACGAAISWFCQGNGIYEVPDTCGPDGFDPCDGPADPVSACP